MSETQVSTKQNRLDRELDVRTVVERPKAWRRPETLPTPNPRPGLSHYWVRFATLGKDDPSNLSSKLREGYEVCKAQDYPELMSHASTNERFKGAIEYGGLILCAMPEEFTKQRSDFYSRQNKAQMDSVDNNFLRENNPVMPLFSERKSSVSFGSGPKP